MRGEAAAIASTLLTPCGVSRIAWTRIGFFTPCRASSSARYWSTKWMSQSPSTLGIITTSSLSPISPTSRVMSSRNQGEFSALTRAHRPVEPKSVALAMAMKPSRAAILDFDRDRVLEIAEDDVDLAGELAGLRPQLLDVRRDEMDHPLELRRQLEIAGAARRSRGARRLCAEISWPALPLRFGARLSAI